MPMNSRRRSVPSLLAAAGLLLALALGLGRLGKPGAPPASPQVRPPVSTDAARALLRSGDAASISAEGAPADSSLPSLLEAGLEFLRREADPIERGKKLEQLVQSIAPAELPMALDLLAHRNLSAIGRDLASGLLRRWAGEDPKTAADWVMRLPAGANRQAAISDVAVVWAGQDLAGAAAWAGQLPEGADRNAGLLNVAYEAARTEPVLALSLAMELPAGPSRDDLITHAASQWAAAAPEAAAQWAKQIPDAALRDRVLGAVATAWGDADAVAAATLAVESISPGRRQNDAAVSVLQRWVQTDPDSAAAWVIQFPEGQLRDAALQNLVSLWTDQDRAGVAKWLENLDPGAIRDLAAAAYASKLSPGFPQLAAQWAEGIGEEPLRSQELENVAQMWLLKAPAAARAWLAGAPLAEDIKARLLASVPIAR